MNQEKLEKAVKYANLMKSKLSDPTPKKHEGRPAQYRELLEREYKKAARKVEDLKLSGADSKK